MQIEVGKNYLMRNGDTTPDCAEPSKPEPKSKFTEAEFDEIESELIAVKASLDHILEIVRQA